MLNLCGEAHAACTGDRLISSTNQELRLGCAAWRAHLLQDSFPCVPGVPSSTRAPEQVAQISEQVELKGSPEASWEVQTSPLCVVLWIMEWKACSTACWPSLYTGLMPHGVSPPPRMRKHERIWWKTLLQDFAGSGDGRALQLDLTRAQPC